MSKNSTEKQLLDDIGTKQQNLIATQIENGQYFVQANKWYKSMYLYPYNQAFYTLLMLLILITTVVVVISIINKQYTSEKIPLAVYNDDQVYFISHIKPLARSYENTNISIARYMLEYYISLRESYSPSLLNEIKWKNFFEQVQALSSRRVFSEFVRYMDTNTNQMSPVLLYRTNTIRVISDIKIIFPEGNYNKPDMATVYFKSTEKGRETGETKEWKANIAFDMSDMYTEYPVQNNLHFIVIKYNITPINSSTKP